MPNQLSHTGQGWFCILVGYWVIYFYEVAISDFGTIFIMLSLFYRFVDVIYSVFIPFKSYVSYNYHPLGGLPLIFLKEVLNITAVT